MSSLPFPFPTLALSLFAGEEEGQEAHQAWGEGNTAEEGGEKASGLRENHQGGIMCIIIINRRGIDEIHVHLYELVEMTLLSQLLGELYADREYLDKLLKDPG